jgi:hypothetical protein
MLDLALHRNTGVNGGEIHLRGRNTRFCSRQSQLVKSACDLNEHCSSGANVRRANAREGQSARLSTVQQNSV